MDVINVTEFNPLAEHFTQILRGTVEPFVGRIDVDGVSDKVILTGINWELFVVLAPGKNEFVLEPYDVSGQKLSSITVRIDLPDLENTIRAVPNSFEDWGLRLNLPRRIAEKNQSYKNRLLTRARSLFNTDVRSVSKAISVDLSLRTVISRFGVFLKRNTSTNLTYLTHAEMAINDSAIEIGADQFLISKELQVVDPVTLVVELNSKLRMSETSGSITLTTANEVLIPENCYNLDLSNNRIIFIDRRYARLDVLISYPYWHRIEYREQTLGFVRTALNSIFLDGNQMIGAEDIDVLPEFEDSTSANNLIQQFQPVTLVAKDEQPLDVSPLNSMAIISVSSVRVKTLSITKGLYVNRRGTHFDAPLGQWRRELLQNSGLIWKHVRFGRALWQEESILPHMNFFPHLLDAARGDYNRKHENEKLTLSQLRTLNLVNDLSIEYAGVVSSNWHSGVGTQGDLFIELVEITRLTMVDYFLQDDAKDAVGLIIPEIK